MHGEEAEWSVMQVGHVGHVSCHARLTVSAVNANQFATAQQNQAMLSRAHVHELTYSEGNHDNV